MEPDEIRAEIQRRKQQAIDLRIREILWSLYNPHHYAKLLADDPELLYPEFREVLDVSDNFSHIQFRVGDTAYVLTYKKKSEERQFWGSRRLEDEVDITHATLALEVDGKLVFDFEVRKMVTYTPDCPVFDETMGEITSFVEGPWVNVIPELLGKIRLHEKAVWDRRNAPKIQQRLEEDKKRFGL
jgi:hypothetical protein